MDKNVIHIDVVPLQKEIQDLEAAVMTARETLDKRIAELESKRGSLNYILSFQVKDPVLINAKKEIPQGKGISEFILLFLGNGRAITTDIITAYAGYTSRNYEDVSNIVSNTLNRLKTTGKIGQIINEGGKKAGSTWFLNE